MDDDIKAEIAHLESELERVEQASAEARAQPRPPRELEALEKLKRFEATIKPGRIPLRKRRKLQRLRSELSEIGNEPRELFNALNDRAHLLARELETKRAMLRSRQPRPDLVGLDETTDAPEPSQVPGAAGDPRDEVSAILDTLAPDASTGPTSQAGSGYVKNMDTWGTEPTPLEPWGDPWAIAGTYHLFGSRIEPHEIAPGKWVSIGGPLVVEITQAGASVHVKSHDEAHVFSFEMSGTLSSGGERDGVRAVEIQELKLRLWLDNTGHAHMRGELISDPDPREYPVWYDIPAGGRGPWVISRDTGPGALRVLREIHTETYGLDPAFLEHSKPHFPDLSDDPAVSLNHHYFRIS